MAGRIVRAILSGIVGTVLFYAAFASPRMGRTAQFAYDSERDLKYADHVDDQSRQFRVAGHGGGITAEAADVVILNDDLSRVVEAIQISRRTVRIALQSIWTGLGLSGLAMLLAGMGYIRPTIGALLQAWILVHFVRYAGSTTFWKGLVTGFWLWLGLTAARIAVHDLFERRPGKLTILTVAHELVTIMVMALIIGLMKP